MANSANSGGGIENDGTMTVSGRCQLSGNTAQFGGGIENFGTVTVSACTISHNTAVNFGGGIDNQFGMVTVENSSVIGRNAAPVGCGADVYNPGTLFLDAGSTIRILDGNPAIPI